MTGCIGERTQSVELCYRLLDSAVGLSHTAGMEFKEGDLSAFSVTREKFMEEVNIVLGL